MPKLDFELPTIDEIDAATRRVDETLTDSDESAVLVAPYDAQGYDPISVGGMLVGLQVAYSRQRREQDQTVTDQELGFIPLAGA
jgi:hypothetical protein